MLEWPGGQFDQEHFDRDQINRELAAGSLERAVDDQISQEVIPRFAVRHAVLCLAPGAASSAAPTPAMSGGGAKRGNPTAGTLLGTPLDCTVGRLRLATPAVEVKSRTRRDLEVDFHR